MLADPAGAHGAFRCQDCELEVYIRPKLGFWNCTTGLSEDAEVDGVSDLDMISPEFEPNGPGERIAAAGLPGRAREYRIRMSDGLRPAVGVALSSSCDLLGAAGLGRSAGRERVLALLDSEPVALWIDGHLGRSPAVVAALRARRE